MNPPIPGTVVIYGPVFARSGFGQLARSWALALHKAGVKIRIVPVDCNDPKASGDLDDCDVYLLQSLKYTPLQAPVTAIFNYVPIYLWPKLQLPEPNLRIMLTTFDSSANAATPPPRLIYICNQMDQTWVANQTEKQAWIRGGMKPEKVHAFNWPHEWIDNPQLGAPVVRKRKPGEPFRFLHISLLLPRRRLDVLTRAFFEEFRKENEAELYLKMAYPTWHPVPGKPKKDLLAMIERLRKETGSCAKVIVDENLGSRLDLARLIDNSDVYVSADTTHTAPVTEAIVRNRPVVITDGWGVDLPPQALVVPNSAERVAITPEMAEYMPHQRGATFPALDVGAMRQALRRTVSWSADEYWNVAQGAASYMRERYSFESTAPAAIAAINQGWADKRRSVIEIVRQDPSPSLTTATRTTKPLNIHWSGIQLFYGKIPNANRGICLELLRRGHRLSLMPANGPFQIEEFDINASPRYQELVPWFHEPLKANADFSVSYRWHPIFNEHPATHQIFGSTWWHGAIPVDWVRPIGEYVSEVWVPSTCVRDNFLRGGIAAEQVQMIPLGVDPDLFHPGIAPYALQTKKRFKFLFVGETTQRKGFDLALQSYLKMFTNRDDVCLVVKDIDCEDYYGRLVSKEVIRKCQADPRAPEIEYIPAMLSEENIAALYAACDCFVQPHRASSSGMAVMEAMACGLPVITTEFGGILDFCSKETALLLPAREVRRRKGFVGHWKVSGEQIHAEPNQRALQERMEQVFKNPSEAKKRTGTASDHVRTNFSWARTVDKIEERFQILQSAPEKTRPRSGSSKSVATTETKNNGPTVVIFAPFYNRSGYGVAARSLAVSLHSAGTKIKTVPVDNVEEGIDDCDMNWLKSLEKTPVTLPVVAIFFHVPTAAWLQVQLPPESVRVMFTTFDSSAQGNLPPADWISVCKQMDQLWLMTEKEAAVFETAGVPRAKIHVVKPPHPWINNPVLPMPSIAAAGRAGHSVSAADQESDSEISRRAGDCAPHQSQKKFRFLCVSMFLPRRRWDTLIEAFLTEFKDDPGVELYLKVNYPSWHPVPGQPQRDLRQLIETSRAKTGSKAEVILDETLGTRLGICRLMDSCDTYISTDTSITAPVGEAFVRGKIAVIPDGYGVALPYCEAAFVIPVDPKLTQPMTEAMLAYQPHHRGKQMPLLRVEDVRQTMRAAYETPEAERIQKGHLASLVMECAYGPANVTPEFIKAINTGLREKFSSTKPVASQASASSESIKLDWVGSFLDHGSLSHVNREMTRALSSHKGIKLQRVSCSADASPAFKDFAREVTATASTDAIVTVRHAWPPNWQRPKNGALVVIQPWEFGALPKVWVEQARNVDEFWLPSEFVRRIYADSGVPANKLVVVPNGVDVTKFNPRVAPMKLATDKKFKFLFVGGTIMRKGPDVLLKAYLDNFTAADDVCLVIKDFGGQSVYAGQTFEQQIRAAQAKANAPEILYLNEEMSPEALPGLYTACDCLVLPYRGEGFGLPAIEAMACGLPVVVTAGGATDDFARDDVAFRIPATKQIFGSEVSGMKLAGSGWMLEPNLAALGEKMRWIFEHPTEARERGVRASKHVQQFWTWKNSAEIIAQRIRELALKRAEARVPERGIHAASTAKSTKAAPIILPSCALLGHLGEARDLIRQKKLPAAWNATLASIAKRPFHPEAYLLLAEIAQSVGDGADAKLCAESARRIAPGFKDAKKFLNQRLKGDSRPSWLTLPESVGRAVPCTPNTANGAHRVTRPTLSVCLIVKNEEKFLGQCLKSVRGLASQIVVVDTGSTDRTIEIAKEHGAEVHSFAWCDDFSAARNAALERATGDWILMLDADEELATDAQEKLKAAMSNDAVMAWRLPIVDIGREADGCSYVPRLFRNAPALFYLGRIHEQVFSSIEVRRAEWGLENKIGDATLIHHGYTAEVTRDRNKVERNLKLLERAIEELPGEPHLLMNYGLELARSGREEEALARYQEAWEILSAKPAAEITPELRETLLTQLCTRLTGAKRFDEIVRVLKSPAAKPAFTASLHFSLGLAHLELKQFSEAADQMRQCLAKRGQRALAPINQDILTAAPHHCLALALLKSGDNANAEKAFQAGLNETGHSESVRLDYAKFLNALNRPVEALERLNEIVTQNPCHVLAWRFGGQIALSQPQFLEFACDWTSEAMKNAAEDLVVTAQRAEALTVSGNTAGALELWEHLCNSGSQPTALAALILCEAIESPTTRAPQDATQEAAVSQAFIQWYQKLLAYRAAETVTRLNEQTEKLRRALPTAGKILEMAMAEANQAVAVGA